ncbi:MAG TPA: TIGR03557 family F420-dependent LLM class oxidoreductase [Chloroflexia bacterium]|nr:TIGR03557 family F420-dependent LLM class oxidoreductase [Chloroflexia bacterium]
MSQTVTSTKGQIALSRQSGPNIGFVLSHEQFPVPQLVEIGATAEKDGFDAVWTSDHFQPWQDNEGHAGQAWVTLAALGQRMPRIPMGTGVTCPTYRYNPAIVAEAFASLALLYPGRVFLGVGSGEALNEKAAGGGWGDYSERSGRLIEAVQLIRQLWSGEHVSFKGQYYQTEKARLYDVPNPHVPIYIAASGPKSMHLAGQYGDGLISDSQRAVQPELRKAFEEGARQAGKDPAQMPIIAEHWVVVGDEEEARKIVPLWNFLPKAWDVFVQDPDPVHIREQATQTVKPEEVLKTWVIGKDPQVHIEALNKLIEQGVSTIFVHSAQADQKMVMDFYSREVLPKVKRK